MLNIEKFMLLSSPHRIRIAEVDSLFVLARTALTLLEFERTDTVRFIAADATKTWDLTNPMLQVDSSNTPDSVGLNAAFKQVIKLDGKRVAAVLGKKKLDPAKSVSQEFARQGILTGQGAATELVATDALDSVLDDLGLVLRGQRTVTQQDRLLLEVIEAINATKLLLGAQRPDWSMRQFSERINDMPSGHPVVAEVRKVCSTMSGLMEKSKMAALSEPTAS